LQEIAAARLVLAWSERQLSSVSLYREASVQQHKSGNEPPGDMSPDSQDRIRDFLGRHGGPGRPRREETHPAGFAGWYEVYAADGYRLRCDWSSFDGREELMFSEIGPQHTEGASDNRA
jgi:hypothetical protein